MEKHPTRHQTTITEYSEMNSECLIEHDHPGQGLTKKKWGTFPSSSQTFKLHKKSSLSSSSESSDVHCLIFCPAPNISDSITLKKSPAKNTMSRTEHIGIHIKDRPNDILIGANHDYFGFFDIIAGK